MATLHVKSPNGTTKSINLETMNITASFNGSGWLKLQNGIIIQWADYPDIATTSGSTIIVNFPLEFPTTMRFITASESDNWSTKDANIPIFKRRNVDTNVSNVSQEFLIIGMKDVNNSPTFYWRPSSSVNCLVFALGW